MIFYPKSYFKNILEIDMNFIGKNNIKEKDYLSQSYLRKIIFFSTSSCLNIKLNS